MDKTECVRVAEKKKLIFLRNMIDSLLSLEDYIAERDGELSKVFTDRLERLYKQTDDLAGEVLTQAAVVELLEESLSILREEPRQIISSPDIKEQQLYGETELFQPHKQHKAYIETTLLEEPLRLPFLVRKSTQEKIFINRDIFKMGKERSCVDYCVDNDTVSRSHADIVRKRNHFFLVDQESLNHTFLEGKKIPARQYVKLESGQSFMLAKEEFVFYYEAMNK